MAWERKEDFFFSAPYNTYYDLHNMTTCTCTCACVYRYEILMKKGELANFHGVCIKYAGPRTAVRTPEAVCGGGGGAYRNFLNFPIVKSFGGLGR